MFFSLLKLKENDRFEWRREHQEAFEAIKNYLAKPPVLMPPRENRLLKLYLAVAEESMGNLLAQDNNFNKEQTIYYLSIFLNSVECKYSVVEKFCLTLYFAAMKLRYYLLPRTFLILI